MVPIFVLLTFVVVVFSTVLIKHYKEKASTANVRTTEKNSYGLLFPLNYLLFDNHIWLKETTDKSYVLGLDELFNNFMGIPDQIYLKNEGDEINEGEQLAILKKGNKEIYLQAPVSGVITKVNDIMSVHPDLINSDPYDQGWLYTFESSSFDKNTNKVKTKNDAKSWLKEEFNRLKEFLQTQSSQFEPVVETLMDGGWPVQGVIEYIDQQTVTLFEKEFLRAEKNKTGISSKSEHNN
ncbi:glycine cleavage system protein H [Candidatus Zixiibacteriota bacterium]